MLRIITASLLLSTTAAAARAGEFVWPTPNPAWTEGKGYEAFIQPTNTGLIESGMFGCGRNSGWKFHEAIDLFPLERDRRGEARDPVFAMADGVVRHVSSRSGWSSYGRYIVIEHTGKRPAIVTLYAHLASIADGVRPGAEVHAGQTIGIMGRSAANYTIPRERAHLHVEAGVWLSRRFQAWYDSRKFSSKNRHGIYNGMNIIGFDLLDYLERERAGQVANVLDYIRRLPTAISVVVKTRAIPDFVTRYPDLVDGLIPADGLAGWRIELTWFGLPKKWTPISTEEMAHLNVPNRAVVFRDAELIERYPCQEVVSMRRGRPVLGSKGKDVIDILFAGL